MRYVVVNVDVFVCCGCSCGCFGVLVFLCSCGEKERLICHKDVFQILLARCEFLVSDTTCRIEVVAVAVKAARTRIRHV
jgi:hypothetical protein